MSFLLAFVANAVSRRAFEAKMSFLAAEIALCFHGQRLIGHQGRAQGVGFGVKTPP